VRRKAHLIVVLLGLLGLPLVATGCSASPPPVQEMCSVRWLYDLPADDVRCHAQSSPFPRDILIANSMVRYWNYDRSDAVSEAMRLPTSPEQIRKYTYTGMEVSRYTDGDEVLIIASDDCAPSDDQCGTTEASLTTPTISEDQARVILSHAVVNALQDNAARQGTRIMVYQLTVRVHHHNG
jgi:hypothetical protein